mgnify:CR=1 FL=1
MSNKDKNIKSFLKPRRGRIRQGYFKPKNPKKYKGDASQIIYRSGWEFKFFKYCDENPKVLEYTAEPVGIGYWHPITKKRATYWIDCYMKTLGKDGNTKEWLIEVKPNKDIVAPTAPKRLTEKQAYRYAREAKVFLINSEKFKAAKEYAKAHNMTFGIITENFLFNKM